jgi:putative multiple sugar transport system substrate-binding protein
MIGAAVVAAGLAFSMTACQSGTGGSGGGGASPDAKTIGISMPSQALERWTNDGQHLQTLLQADGFNTTLQFGHDQVDQQVSQIQNMINDGVSLLIIAAIDGTSLTPILQTAADQGIPVIAYDRLIMDTPNVAYYATFDNFLVGKMQGEYIVEQLGLATGATGPFNIELFAGSPDDNNAAFFFGGAWSVLEPYFASGVLVSPSGNVPTSAAGWQAIGVQGWSTQTAMNVMQTRLNSFYTGGKRVDAVLSPNDSLAQGISQALQQAGYTAADFPILTGQDADVASVQNIINGVQTMTVWKDTRMLGDQVAKMARQILNNETVDVNNTTDYNNNVLVVPSFLINPTVVTKANVCDVVTSGFIAANQLTGITC